MTMNFMISCVLIHPTFRDPAVLRISPAIRPSELTIFVFRFHWLHATAVGTAPMAMADAIRVSPPRRRPSLRSEITRQRSALSGSERSRANYATGSGTHANRALCLSSDIACLRCVPVRHVHARRGCQ